MPHIELLSSVSPSARGTSGMSNGKTTASGDDVDAAVNFEVLLELGLRANDTPIENGTKRQSGDASADASGLATATLAVTTQQRSAQAQDNEVSAEVSEIVDATAHRKTSQANLLREARGTTDDYKNGQDFSHETDRNHPGRSAGIEAALQRSATVTPSTQERLAAASPLSVESTSPTTAQPPLSQGLEMLARSAQSTAGTPVTTVEIPERIGTSAWSESFAQKIVVVAGRNEQIAEIRLNPPHLGPIEVSIAMTGDEQRNTTLHFSAHHASVREAIENALPRLREMFEEAGISLGNATVGSEASSHSDAQSDDAGSTPDRTQNTDMSTDAEQRTNVRSLPLGGVDTFA